MYNIYKLDDNQLIALHKEGNGNAFELIYERYGKLIKSVCRKYFLIGGDEEDLLQVALLGLLDAVNNYDSDKGATFKTYAYTCIENKILKAIKKANTLLNEPLSNAVPIDTVTIVSRKNPEVDLIKAETVLEINQMLDKKLSTMEREILTHYLQGKKYEEISKETGKDKKAIDNAIQRIMKKVRGQISN